MGATYGGFPSEAGFLLGGSIQNNGAMQAVGKAYFPDPWCDYASLEMPKSLSDVLQWCEFIWLTNGTFRMASERVVRYFLTSLEVSEVSDEEAQKYVDYLMHELKVMDKLAVLGDDFMCYGNSFSSVFVPFDRFLRCPKCLLERPIEQVNFQFTKDYEFGAKCPACGYEGNFVRRDRRASVDDDVRLIRWSPHQISLQYNPISHDVEYRYRIPEHLKKRVKEGDSFYLRTTPWEMIECIRDDKLFRFNKEFIYHMREETLAGVNSVGWGIPRLISNFKQAYYIQVLKRYNEALAMDYIVPFRVITPQGGNSAAGDPLIHSNLGVNKGHIQKMLTEHRRDPASYHFLPFPIDYRALGGEGTQLTNYQLIESANDELLNATGIPAEMYRGTLSVQAAPTSLRMFQQTWPHLVSAFTGWLNWLAFQLMRIKSWEPARVGLQPVTMADDLEKKNILLQLAAGQQISNQTAMAPFGIDYRKEITRVLDEQQFMEEKLKDAERQMLKRQKMDEALATAEQQEAADQMAQQGAMIDPATGQPMSPEAAAQMAAQTGGTAPMGGAPAPVGGGVAGGGLGGGLGGGSLASGLGSATTPQEMMVQAEQIAAQLLQMPYEARKSEMLKIKRSDEALHALVKSKMETIRQQTNQAAGYQALQSGQMVGTNAGGGM